ncbi:endoglucanase [Clostridium felsineum]|uniref:Uncharacterized protein n=1 Tax=Clostridium felsineum TaxID=36839 RepID=A0A1S8LP51_9CLOT|nr:endoglucanase [Clostridium felsineum]MCR3761301.1 endoglucanase [Clostridium felsineum]URZ01510.1 hypothetical protein CLAUR_015050 [Clostridium felsineum]URZ05643.1 hypothetical protein CLROS_009690 [Clostridium felsineum]URZ10682.1 hypothetical protein CROST_013920 [Clostridium felsineum]URZ17404.1 hypothetical protein CLFE_034570 [Clostridium felsineum DSM 794]
MSMFLLIILLFLVLGLLPSDVLTVHTIPKEFENYPEISQMKFYDKYMIKKGV